MDEEWWFWANILEISLEHKWMAGKSHVDVGVTNKDFHLEFLKTYSLAAIKWQRKGEGYKGSKSKTISHTDFIWPLTSFKEKYSDTKN